MEAAPRVPPGFWPFADKSDIRPAERSAESSPDFVGHETRSIRRFSSAVEQRFCKLISRYNMAQTGERRTPCKPLFAGISLIISRVAQPHSTTFSRDKKRQILANEAHRFICPLASAREIF